MEEPIQQPLEPERAEVAGKVAPPSGGAVTIAAGILLSRVIGLLRERAIGYYFGLGPYADVLRVALRAPNILQNLLGEGTLSAAFIPIYSRLIEQGKREEAGRFAGAVFGLLLAAAAALSLLGVVLARPLVAVLANGFLNDTGAVDRFELTVTTTRIIFPMTGFLVLSVWALGVLNSHRRFFLPYFAPVVWNAAIIGALLWAGGLGRGGSDLERLLFAACWGALAGGLLQFLVQLPGVARELRGFRLSFSARVPGVKEALGAFGPVVAGRGVVQLSGYLDVFLASYLVAGAPAALSAGQMLYTLPISLFGMSVAAAELPELSRLQQSGGAGSEALIARIRRSLRQMAFLNVPTFLGYLAFGFLLVAALNRTGRFGVAETWLVYLILFAYTLGLLASTSSRLLQNTFYALGETRTPARIAATRVGLSAVLGIPLMLALDRIPVTVLAGESAAGSGLHLGAVGLALASGVGSWFELLRLRAALTRRMPAFHLPWRETGRLLLLAAGAGLPSALLWAVLPALHPLLLAPLVLLPYALVYLGLARFLAPEELAFWVGRFGRRLRRSS
ncbi:MAG TPA: murein biosynthesis integral membrane protein MurJ [Thermoanaerobaculia bacterium]|nr:murein biosynthesis integral membrane protein MurJ [Thermoanaerobaculia bacterium]